MQGVGFGFRALGLRSPSLELWDCDIWGFKIWNLPSRHNGQEGNGGTSGCNLPQQNPHSSGHTTCASQAHQPTESTTTATSACSFSNAAAQGRKMLRATQSATRANGTVNRIGTNLKVALKVQHVSEQPLNQKAPVILRNSLFSKPA